MGGEVGRNRKAGVGNQEFRFGQCDVKSINHPSGASNRQTDVGGWGSAKGLGRDWGL